jgi:ABC-type glycerol-3-phosphate transport system substrate-binding protein
MYDVTINKTLIALAAATLVLAGCGGSTSTSNSSSSSASASGSQGAPSSSGAPQFTDQQAPPAQLVIEATIAHGNVTPTNEQLQGKVGEAIVVRIDSDAVDELHAHSTPDHTFKVEAKPNQSFQFTATVPGKIDIELHGLKRVIATVEVQ